jgi:hypothetical protein
MDDSILNSVKKVLGIDAEYTAFDPDIIMHINSVFVVLNDMGIGPDLGYAITDNTAKWSDFLGADPRLNSVQTYVFLRVRLLFDPPTVSYLIDSMKEQIREFGWRLSTHREGESWTDPNPVPPVS